MRTQQEWLKWCRQISAGYTPAGKKEVTYFSGVVNATFLLNNGFVFPGVRVLDVGSGNGRMAMGLYALNIANLSYVGLEIIKPCVTFCKKAFREFANYKFYHLDIQNKRYWSKGTILPADVVYPVPTATFDLITAISLFSHTGTLQVAKKNLLEMKRALAPGGAIFSTWYFDDIPNTSEKKTVYRFRDITALLASLDLSYTWINYDPVQSTLVLKQRKVGY